MVYLLIITACSVNFIGQFLGATLSLWSRNLITRVGISLGMSAYLMALVSILDWTLVDQNLSSLVIVGRFGFKKLISI